MTDLAAPMMIGPVKTRNRVFLAPMSGVSDLPFRVRAWRHGAGLVVSEMIASEEYCREHRESRKRADTTGLGIRMVQLAGREAHWMGEAARMAEQDGADIVDINMGCPAKKVTGGYSGSALMRDLDHAMTLVEATVKAVNVPVTLKMRLGWDAGSINAPELARRAEEAGVAMVTVHGRTRDQLYNGEADWRRIADVREAISVPLVVNGDIGSADDAARALHASGADAVMIGRAAYAQPWLPGEIAASNGSSDEDRMPAPAPEAIGDYIVGHYEEMLAHYGIGQGLRHARKHLGWYLDRFADELGVDSELRRRVMTSTDHREVIGIISGEEQFEKAKAA